MPKQSTSWEESAEWYQDLVENRKDNYQKDVILPNILRLAGNIKGKTVIDLACGQGFFSRNFFMHGARVLGVDISPSLIDFARKNSPKEIEFKVSPADKLGSIKSNSADILVIIMAIQNIENPSSVFAECARVLKPDGRLLMVMNHPAFRVPQRSDWGFDAEKKVQYRRVDGYLSESKVNIRMHPGIDPKDVTISFHRPLQVYFKFLNKTGFAVSKLEEWISNKKSEKGPRQKAEDIARKEIPLFLFIEATKLR